MWSLKVLKGKCCCVTGCCTTLTEVVQTQNLKAFCREVAELCRWRGTLLDRFLGICRFYFFDFRPQFFLGGSSKRPRQIFENSFGCSKKHESAEERKSTADALQWHAATLFTKTAQTTCVLTQWFSCEGATHNALHEQARLAHNLALHCHKGFQTEYER